jgi:hypothetical protein
MGEMVEASGMASRTGRWVKKYLFIIQISDPGALKSADVVLSAWAGQNLPPTFDHGGVHINSNIISTPATYWPRA